MLIGIETNFIKHMVMLTIDIDLSYFNSSISTYKFICVITLIRVNVVVVVVFFISVTCGMKYIIINIYKHSVHKLARLPPSPTGLTSHNESTLHKIIFGRW